MPFPWAAAVPLGMSLAGKLFGPDQKTEAVVPDDLQPMRQQQIGLLNFLLGMGPDPRSFNPDQMMQTAQQKFAQARQGGPSDLARFIQSHPDTMALLQGRTPQHVPGTRTPWGFAQQQWGGGQGPVSLAPGGQFDLGAAMNTGAQTFPGMGPAPNINTAGTGGGQVTQGGGGMMTPQQRLESFFGPLGITQSGLQQQATGALSGLLGGPSPEQRAAEITLPQLQQGLTGNPQTQAATNALMGLQTGAGADVEGRLSQIGDRPITGFGDLDQVLRQIGGGGQGINFGPSGAGMDILRQIAQSNPGQGVVDALQPTFQRNLASANQQGGRFGSGNAVLRSRAVDDFNLTAANALQRGVDQQTAAANALGQLGLGGDQLRLQGLLGGQQGQLDALRLATSGAQGLDQSALQALNSLGGLRLQGQGQQAQNLQAAGQLGLGQGQLQNQTAQTLAQILGQQGQADLNRASTAFNAGTINTQQQNVGNQRAIDILLQQLGTAQSATLGGPVQQTPSGAQQGAQLGGDIAQLLLLSQYLSGNQGGNG